ncbi:MAG: hypothetical protein HW384_1125 [Dehalococcoidia bacterium]|nr:hypothetical protein [Dehalococcoidia bacterium]MBF8303756.1 hypothetical protein [Dehalococcoidia bacterium]
MDELHMKRLLSTLKCALCGKHYKLQELQVLGHRDDLWFLNVHCVSCGSRGMMAVVIKESNAYQVVTDLLPSERDKFINTAVIGGDDLLDIHQFFKDFDGDFNSLFLKK